MRPSETGTCTAAVAVNDAAVPSDAVKPRHWADRRRVIAIELALPLMFAGAYVAYQRIGTTANVSLVEFTPNLAGGFLAVGMTEEQPGFIVLSAMDRKKVDVHANKLVNRVAGTHTVAAVHTPRAKWENRLRGPKVALIDKDGQVETVSVDWSHDEFEHIQEATDCSHNIGKKRRRCGMPFADLHETLSRWPKDRVPGQVREFLSSFAPRPRTAGF